MAWVVLAAMVLAVSASATACLPQCDDAVGPRVAIAWGRPGLHCTTGNLSLSLNFDVGMPTMSVAGVTVDLPACVNVGLGSPVCASLLYFTRSDNTHDAAGLLNITVDGAVSLVDFSVSCTPDPVLLVLVSLSTVFVVGMSAMLFAACPHRNPALFLWWARSRRRCLQRCGCAVRQEAAATGERKPLLRRAVPVFRSRSLSFMTSPIGGVFGVFPSIVKETTWDTDFWATLLYIVCAAGYCVTRLAPDYVSAHPRLGSPAWILLAGMYIFSAVLWERSWSVSIVVPPRLDMAAEWMNVWLSVGFTATAVLYLWPNYDTVSHLVTLTEFALYVGYAINSTMYFFAWYSHAGDGPEYGLVVSDVCLWANVFNVVPSFLYVAGAALGLTNGLNPSTTTYNTMTTMFVWCDFMYLLDAFLYMGAYVRSRRDFSRAVETGVLTAPATDVALGPHLHSSHF